MLDRFALTAALALAAPAAAAPDVARGEYLVTRVVLCGDCHTPKAAGGAPVAGKALAGAPFPGGPPNDPHFVHYAPAIAGLPAGRTAADVAVLLATGAYPDGTRPRPPMPSFRWDRADAEAGAAYLASLKSQP
jgi:mono/diheme cytochrome c family protein